MKVNKGDVHPDFRRVGQLMKVLFPAKISAFKKTHKQEVKKIGTPLKGYDSSTVWIERGGKQPLRVRLYKRKGQMEKVPGVLYCHGGGYVMNIPESDHETIEHLLSASPCVIVAPDYQKSIEGPYPGALEDAYSALEWMVEESEALKIDQKRIFTAGISAGGGLAVGVTLLARDKGEIDIAFQMPLYPMLDCRMKTSSMKENDAPVWSEAHNRLAWELYLKGVEAVPIYASPSLCKDFSNMPPAISMVGALDPFSCEVQAYIKALQEEGIEAELKIYKGVYHAFEIVNSRSEVSKAAIEYIKDRFAYACDHYRVD